MSDASLTAAAAAVDAAAAIVTDATRHVAKQATDDGGRISVAKLDRHQVVAYDLAHAASAIEGCRVMPDYAGHGDLESMLASAFIADAIADVDARLIARDEAWGVEPGLLAAAR